MSRFASAFVAVLTLLAVAMMCLPAEAQPGGGRGPGGRGAGRMMMGRGGMMGGRGVSALTAVGSKSVKEMLGITEEQTARIERISEERREAAVKHREEMRERFSALRDVSEEDRTAALAKIREEAEKREEELNEQVADVLTDVQKKKLLKIMAQILVQTQGPAALVKKPVVKYAGLSEEQTKKIRGILDESRQQLMAAFREGGRGGSEEEGAARREKFQAMRKEATAKAREILNSDQQAKIKELIQAERIELDMRRPGGHGRGDGRGDGRGHGGRRGQGGQGGMIHGERAEMGQANRSHSE